MEQEHLSSPGQAGRSGLTREEILRRLAEAPRRQDRSDDGTAGFLSGDADDAPAAPPPRGKLTAAAVLVPLVRRETGLTVLLTRRTAHLANHAGQISFPGGRVEDGDRDAVETALRETEEEIGLSRKHVETLGLLDPYVTITGFLVTPVVGLVTPPFKLTLDVFEVDEAFEVPLAFFLDRANHQRHFRATDQGRKRYYWAMPYQDRYIWGATAGMLVNLSEVLG